MNLNPRTQRLLTWIGYPLLALFLFFVFLYLMFPYERVRQQLEDHLSASGEAEVQIGELGPRLLFGLNLRDVVVRIVPKAPRRSRLAAGAEPPAPAKPQILRFSKVGTNIGLFALIGGRVSSDFELVLPSGGEVEGTLETSKAEGFSIEMEANGVRANELPISQGGPPLAGVLALELDLKVPQRKWSKAEGLISFRCKGCSYGDGKALLKVPGNPWLSAGVTIPRVKLGDVNGEIQLTKGAARLERIGATSSDIKLELLGSVSLADPVPLSRLDLKLRFKIEAALKQKIAVLDLIEGQLRRFKGADGFYALPVKGTLRKPQIGGMGGGRRTGRLGGFPPG